MNEAHLNKRYSSFVIGLLILFPIVINSVKILGNMILLILVIFGLYIAIAEKKNPFKIVINVLMDIGDSAKQKCMYFVVKIAST